MDPFLDQIYGTSATIGATGNDEIEKLAEARIMDELFASEGVDVNQLDGGTILKVAHQLFGDESALIKAAQEDGEEDEEDEEGEEGEEGEVKEAARADMLGRIMAHSFTQERAEIEKQAAAPSLLKRLGMKAKKHAITAKEPYHYYKAMRGTNKMTAGQALKATAKAHKGHMAVGGGLVAGAGGLGTAAALRGRGDKEVVASAFDSLVQQRALELLEQAGY